MEAPAVFADCRRLRQETRLGFDELDLDEEVSIDE